MKKKNLYRVFFLAKKFEKVYLNPFRIKVEIYFHLSLPRRENSRSLLRALRPFLDEIGETMNRLCDLVNNTELVTFRQRDY
jgi:hypothetical protein